MEIEKRKMAAISAAVSAYRKEEKETSAIESPTTSFQVSPNVWGLSGRQAIMHMRNSLQCRILHK
ncbi:MAG: hypothetical protein FD151_621 [bacterium]|nr:MAG: hypothetical protein FD151_621 [bacterium]